MRSPQLCLHSPGPALSSCPQESDSDTCAEPRAQGARGLLHPRPPGSNNPLSRSLHCASAECLPPWHLGPDLPEPWKPGSQAQDLGWGAVRLLDPCPGPPSIFPLFPCLGTALPAHCCLLEGGVGKDDIGQTPGGGWPCVCHHKCIVCCVLEEAGKPL